MMSTVGKKIEAAANIAIIVVAVILGAILVRQYYFANNRDVRSASADPRIPAGTRILLPDIDWADHRQTLLLFLSTDCHFCSESAPFYQQLVRATAGRRDIHLVAVLPQELSRSQEYLKELGLSIEEVKQASFKSIGVRATPTLTLVDSAGVVAGSWVGRLAAGQESEVLSRLQVDGGSQVTAANDPKTSIEPVELKRALDGGNRVVVLDVRDREDYAQGHIPGARNIPVDELDIRAGNELSGSDLIVIYCRCADDELSKMASESLHRQGFHQAVVLNGGLDAWRQSGLPMASQ